MAAESKSFGPPWTVLKLLEWSQSFFAERGIDSARLEAELLLSHVLDIDRVRLYMEFDRPLEPDELDAYRGLVKRRCAREPSAHLTGRRAFWTLDLKTDSRALIPRSDTEVVVEEVLERLDEDADLHLVDVGTGTGALALAIASERPGIRVTAIDVSADALSLARENVVENDLSDRVTLVEGDLLSPINEWVDYIVSNPPYVETDAELAPEVKEYDPGLALFAGSDGLDVLEKLVPAALEALRPGGWFTTEIGYQQGDSVQALFREAGFADVKLRKDYGGNPRAVSGRKPE